MRAKYKVGFFVGLSQIRRSWDLVKFFWKWLPGAWGLVKSVGGPGSAEYHAYKVAVPVKDSAYKDTPYRRAPGV